ncbi:hypothetical protein WME98_35865 [Sorangium sp. So ce296]
MISLLLRIESVSAVAVRRSVPMISGAAIIAHIPMCVRYSVSDIPPFPLSSMSGSFQCPGAAYCASRTLASMMDRRLDQLSLMSPVVRQRFPTPTAHSQGLDWPHSQIEYTMLPPAWSSASRMAV